MKVLTTEEYLERMGALRETVSDGMVAMYSSLVDGVVTDRKLMQIPLDDHMACRGHAVFDTCTLKGGKLYRLDRHMKRLMISADKARIPLPYEGAVEGNIEKMKQLVVDTVKVAGVVEGSVRYFLSVGPGNFGFSPAGCVPAFYVIVFKGAVMKEAVVGHEEVTVTDVPHKDAFMVGVKSNNYLQNTLVTMKAKDKGGLFGLQMSPDGGTISESCMLGVIVITKDKEMATPPLTHVLTSCTVEKIMSLAPSLQQAGHITTSSTRPITLPTVLSASELIFVGGDTHLFPITKLNGTPIGTATPGPVYHALVKLIDEEIANGTECVEL